MHIETYLNFDGRCEEALEFYRGAIGAEILGLRRFSEIPGPPPADSVPAGSGNKVMHSMFRVGSTTVMASDGQIQNKPNFQGFSLSLTVKDEAEADRAFAALSAGGQATMPLTSTFFATRFGMLTDRFGVSWMIYLPRPMANPGR